MQERIVIDDTHSFDINNNVAWMMIYKSQFGHDIIPELMPLLGAAKEMITGLAEGGLEIKDPEDLIKRLDQDVITNMLIELAALESVAFYNICWAMAKCQDPSIPEPITWLKQFDTGFPLDIIAPKVMGTAIQGVVSEKNWTRLQEQISSLRPKKKKKRTSNKSSRQESQTESA